MTDTNANALVWVEIPVTNMDSAIKYYNSVFEFTLTIDETGPNPMAMFPDNNAQGTAGHLYPGKPAVDGQGPTPHLAIQGKLEDAIDRCNAAGGRVLGPIVTIPPGRFVYTQDPDGNSIGMFEVAM